MNDTANNYYLFLEKPSCIMGNPKRYAIYFPSKASIEAEKLHGESDDDSTWEFCAPISPSSRSSSTTSAPCTPAQEIIIRYRSGMSLETRSTSPSLYSEPDCWEMSSPTALSHLEHVPVTPDEDIKARYRQSHYDALQNTVCQILSGVSSRINPGFSIKKLLTLPEQLV